MPKLSTIIYIAVIGTCAGVVCVYAFWWVVSRYKLGTARGRVLRSARKSLWRDPGEVERLDFRNGPGGPEGAPAPPFRFMEEHSTGSNPCLSLKDAKGRTWRVKWGDEVRSETFATRLVWAAGFHVEQAYFVAEGHIEGATGLG
ncbi:MAG TPA: hypothetical protein VNI02_10075, partial [Blastocatellia bacterium]|nr:hypothetical protein [Blastocatellia bacterium]